MKLRYDKECPVCKEKFVAARRDQKYCSKACKQLAYRQRQEERRRQGVFLAARKKSRPKDSR